MVLIKLCMLTIKNLTLPLLPGLDLNYSIILAWRQDILLGYYKLIKAHGKQEHFSLACCIN